jgi:hypothetical protein
MNLKVRVVITGSTGMVGEGVLHECLMHPDVEHVLVINRKACGVIHPKLHEIIHQNFLDLSPIKEYLINYNACFFCLGITSIGMKEPEYRHLTYDLTMHVAQTLCGQNQGMVFTYVSGSGTDSTEKGRQMWARVKGKTENDLMKLPFKKTYMFRPAIIEPTKGLKKTLKFYTYLGWMLPIIRFLSPKFVCTMKELGLAMIHTVTVGYEKQILEVKDIVEIANI